jgi:hypothetical protein
MPSLQGLPPARRPRVRAERDSAALGRAQGGLASVTTIWSAAFVPLIGTARCSPGFSVTPAISQCPNDKNGAAREPAGIAHFRRPIPSLGNPRATIPA